MGHAEEAFFLPMGAQQLSTKSQAFTGYRATKGTTAAEIATTLSTLQYEIGSIDLKEKPTDSMKIGLLFQALKGLNHLYEPNALTTLSQWFNTTATINRYFLCDVPARSRLEFWRLSVSSIEG